MRAPRLLLLAAVLVASSCDAPGVLSPDGARFAISPEIAQPTNVQVERTENGRVLISFDHDGTALHRLILSRSTSATGPWVEVHGTNKSHARLFSDGDYPVTAYTVWWRVTACTVSRACSDSEPVSRSDLRIAAISGGSRANLPLESTGDSVTIQWRNDTNHEVWGNEARLRSFELVVLRVGPDGDSTTFVREIPRMLPHLVFTDSTPAAGVIYRYVPHVRNLVGAGPASAFRDVFTGSPARPVASVTRDAAGRAIATVGHDGAGVDEWHVHARRPGEPWALVWRRDDSGQRSFELPYDPDHDVWEWRVLACAKTTSYEIDPEDGRNLHACASSEILRLDGLQLYPPTNLHLVSNEPYRVRLGWTDGAGPIVRTAVLRREAGGGTATRVGTVPFGVTAYEDVTAKPWLAYEYRIYSYNAVGTTDTTAWVHVPPSQTSFPPPQAVTDSAAALTSGIRVYGRALRTPAPQMVTRAWMQWSASPDFSGAQQTTPVTLGADTLVRISGTFTPPVAGTYYYRAVAENELGDRAYGDTRTFAYRAPPAPTDLAGTAYPSGAVAIFFTHSGTQVTRWRLFRRALGSPTWVNVRNDTDRTARHLIDSSVPGGPSGYEWRVEACTYQLCTPSAPYSFGGG